MSRKIKKKAYLKQIICHEIVEGKNWQEAEKVLQVLIHRALEQFDLWRPSKDILSITGPNANFAQLRDVGTEMRGVCTLMILYQE